MNFFEHKPPIRLGHLPAILFIEAVRIGRKEIKAANRLEFRMIDNGLHHPFAQAVAAMGRIDKDIAEIGVGGQIGNHPADADLAGLGVIDAKAEGMLDRLGRRSPAECPWPNNFHAASREPDQCRYGRDR